jgi:hypothetical protein
MAEADRPISENKKSPRPKTTLVSATARESYKDFGVR